MQKKKRENNKKLNQELNILEEKIKEKRDSKQPVNILSPEEYERLETLKNISNNKPYLISQEFSIYLIGWFLIFSFFINYLVGMDTYLLSDAYLTTIRNENFGAKYLPTIIIILLFFILGSLFIRVFMHLMGHENQRDGVIVTNYLDDYIPRHRKIRINAKPEKEEGYHVKLNYQYLIEKMTRKLFICFIGIMFASYSFIYIIYITSLSERIAPETNVMTQYSEMIDTIIQSEKKMSKAQISMLNEFLRDSLNQIDEFTLINKDSSNRENLTAYVIKKFIDNEDAIIKSVSDNFFWVYFFRYLVVRLFIASIMITIIGYLIRLYFRIREDRNDLIRKEEALSTLFFVLDSIEGYDPQNPSKKRFITLQNKIPDFPLLKLFDHTRSSDKSKSEDLLSEINKITAIYKNLTPKLPQPKESSKKDK